MGSLFASHRGRVFKKVALFSIAAAFIMMLFNGGGGTPAEDPTVMAADSGPQVNYSRVYAEAKPAPSATPTAPVAGNDEAVITQTVKDMSRDFITAWTTYDYQTPPSYSVLEGAAQDPANNAELVRKHEELVEGMKARSELSTGNVGSLNITRLDYVGTARQGEGEGTVKATVNTTVSNSEVGSAGTTIVQVYEIKLRKEKNSRTADAAEWYIYDIVPLSGTSAP